MTSRSREEWLAWLQAQKAVTFVSTLRNGEEVMLHTRDPELVSALQQRGAWVRWFDRTMYSTKAGSEPDMQADVTLGPQFWNTEVPS